MHPKKGKNFDDVSLHGSEFGTIASPPSSSQNQNKKLIEILDHVDDVDFASPTSAGQLVSIPEEGNVTFMSPDDVSITVEKKKKKRRKTRVERLMERLAGKVQDDINTNEGGGGGASCSRKEKANSNPLETSTMSDRDKQAALNAEVCNHMSNALSKVMNRKLTMTKGLSSLTARTNQRSG